MDAFTKRISSKIAPVLGSEPSAMFKQSSSSIMRRSMTMREIELRRHLSSNVADDDNPDADLVRTEAESTRHAHPGAARGDAWTANLERAAEHLVDSIHLPTPRAVSMEERTAMAACFVRHAITRTPLTEGINWQSPVARAVHRWRQHTAYEWTRRLALLALLLLVLWEPPVTGGGATASAGWAACSVIEIVCSVAFLGDLVLMLLCTSPRHFFRSPSSCAFGLIVITISLDALVCAFYVGVQQPLLTQFTPVETRPYPLRVSRVARPFLLPFVWKTVGHMTLAIIRSLPSLADLSILILATLVFSTLLGLAFFGIDPEALLAADHAASGAASGFTANPANSTRGIFLLDAEWAPPWAAAALSSVNATPSDEGHRLVLMQLQRPLATMPTMVVQLAVAFFTADNYPQILYESFRCDGVGCNAFVGTSFFVILIIVGHVILMTVFIAVVYDVYKRQHAYLILYERVAERQALLAAFTILDIDGDRRLSRAEFSRLLGAVRPNVDAETVELTFRLIDADRSDTVDRYEFVEAAVALMVRVPRARVGEWAPWATWRSVHVGALVEHRAFSAMCDVAIVMYIILLLLTASGAKWSKGTFAVLDGLDVAFIVYFTLEVLLKLVGLSFETFWQDDWNRVDAFVVPLSVATLVLESALQANSTAASAQASAGSSVRALRLLRLLRLGRLFRVFGKVVNSTIKTKVLLATVSRFGRVMSPMLGVLLMLMYAFSIVGMELMHGSLDPNYSASISGCAPLCPSFATVATSWRTLFQVLLGANWTSLLVEATARDKGSVLPAIFFLCFVTICHVLMLSSLVVALMLEVYDRETEKAARAASADDKMSILCDTIAPPAPNDPTLSVQTVLFSAVRDKFAKYDSDHSGELRIEELQLLLADLGDATLMKLDEAGLNSFFAELDLDQSGVIDFEEFLPWWRKRGISTVFSRHDTDGSQTIDAKELELVMTELGISTSPELCKDALTRLDTDGSGSISLDEYLKWFELYDLQNEFSSHDGDGSGSISLREFVKLCRSLGLALSHREAQTVFAKLDADDNGSIGFSEFYPWWRAVKARSKDYLLSHAMESQKDWEEELFLHEHDQAERKAKEILARMLDEMDKKLECGSLERTAEAVVQHLRRMQGPAEQSDRAPGASSPPVVVSEM